MIFLKQIIEYIKKKYNPLSIILYGSYADGSNNMNSDFDALVISYEHEQFHDTSIVNEIQLDVFVYPAAYFENDYKCNDFIQIFDGQIIIDDGDRGKILQNRVLSYLEQRQNKSKQEIQANIDWCAKMYERAKRCDVEGMFRWHWVLIDGLEIFCDMTQHPYFGPKRSLKWMKENYPTAFECYEKALNDFSMESLEKWITYLKEFERLYGEKYEQNENQPLCRRYGTDQLLYCYQQ